MGFFFVVSVFSQPVSTSNTTFNATFLYLDFIVFTMLMINCCSFLESAVSVKRWLLKFIKSHHQFLPKHTGIHSSLCIVH